MTSLEWLAPKQIENLRPARGVADESFFQLNILGGWIFLPDQEMTAAQIHLNGKPLAYVPLWHRPDVAEIYPRFPHAIRSGYQIKLPAGLLRQDGVNRVVTIGHHGDHPVARQRTILFADEVAPDVPLPTPSLIELTQGNQDPAQYKRLGYRFYRHLLDVIDRHRDAGSIRRILDWGCGSGRVAANFLSHKNQPAVCGCDVNAEAIQWCRANLSQWEFHVTGRMPPLPVPDAAFDLILALGVVGGFGPAEFEEWLPELKRVLAPKGLLIISTQGVFSAAVRFPPDALASLAERGFLDGSKYDEIHPPSPDERLYRGGFYWTPEWIAANWSRHFRILEHLVGEFGSDQDLVVMDKYESVGRRLLNSITMPFGTPGRR
jgi:SAM-dependent methyltransferase